MARWGEFVWGDGTLWGGERPPVMQQLTDAPLWRPSPLAHVAETISTSELPPKRPGGGEMTDAPLWKRGS
jgi:hypothetical protein